MYPSVVFQCSFHQPCNCSQTSRLFINITENEDSLKNALCRGLARWMSALKSEWSRCRAGLNEQNSPRPISKISIAQAFYTDASLLWQEPVIHRISVSIHFIRSRRKTTFFWLAKSKASAVVWFPLGIFSFVACVTALPRCSSGETEFLHFNRTECVGT